MLEVQTDPGDIPSSALPQAAVKGERTEPALDTLSGGQQTQHVDVLIVGAGLSGIGAAYYLQAHCPAKSFAILEERHTLGGTWDLFRHPGIRSDPDMYTLGFSFRPWRSDKSIAGGPSILQYLRDTAKEHGIDRAIRFGHRVIRAPGDELGLRLPGLLSNG